MLAAVEGEEAATAFVAAGAVAGGPLLAGAGARGWLAGAGWARAPLGLCTGSWQLGCFGCAVS